MRGTPWAGGVNAKRIEFWHADGCGGEGGTGLTGRQGDQEGTDKEKPKQT